MLIKLSIIIPVYNAAPFLAACLDAVLGHKSSAIEIICINDGSSDNSLDILNSYAQQDSRLTVISQHNQGVSAARNRGIQQATGQYITFIDADDTITPNSLCFIDTLSTNPDIILGDSFLDKNLFDNNTNTYDRTFIVNKLIPAYLQTEHNNSVCDKYYKRSIITQYNLSFPEGKALGEDGVFNVRFLLHAHSLLLLPNASYIYRQNEDSATNSLNKHDFLNNFIEDCDRYAAYYHLMPYSASDIAQWTSLKMLKNILSVLSLYFRSSSKVAAKERRNSVLKMLHHEKVNVAMNMHYSSLQANASMFDKMIIWAIKHQSYTLLKMLFAYSHYRNGIK